MKTKAKILATLIGLAGLNTQASATTTECDNVLSWAHNGWQLDQNSRGGFHQGNRVIQALKDEYFQPVFNTSLDQLNMSEIASLKDRLKACATFGRKHAHELKKQGNRDKAREYQLAGNYINIVLRVNASDRDPANFVKTFTHQQSVLSNNKKAVQLAQQQLVKAADMTPSLANISALASMQQNPTLAYLGTNERQTHNTRLNNASVKLADLLIEQKIESFEGFEASFSGLQAFNKHITQIRSELGRVKATKWPMFEQNVHAITQALTAGAAKEATAKLDKFGLSYEGLKELLAYKNEASQALNQAGGMRSQQFEKTYTEKLNQIAAAALSDFETELKAIPVSEQNLRLVHKSVQRLFSQPPLPDNIDQYRQTALRQVSFMEQQLTKGSCYKGLTAKDLDGDAHDIALLDADGASTLGLFICQLMDNGYQLMDYESPGLFGDTHVLSVKSPRGIGLSIELEPVEVNPGEELLVGIAVKDAMEEQSFNLAQWQNYAMQLANGR